MAASMQHPSTEWLNGCQADFTRLVEYVKQMGIEFEVLQKKFTAERAENERLRGQLREREGMMYQYEAERDALRAQVQASGDTTSRYSNSTTPQTPFAHSNHYSVSPSVVPNNFSFEDHGVSRETIKREESEQASASRSPRHSAVLSRQRMHSDDKQSAMSDKSLSSATTPSFSSPPQNESPTAITSDSSFKCSKCPKLFASLRSMHSHRSAHSRSSKRDSKHVCSVCHRSCSTVENLRRHTQAGRCSEQVSAVYKCAVCHKAYSNESSLRSHMVRSHPRRAITVKHQCAACSRVFPFLSDLRRHIARGHAIEGMFECKECEKKFRLLSSLQKHSVRHRAMVLYDEEKANFECGCGRGFQLEMALKKHSVGCAASYAEEEREARKRFGASISVLLPKIELPMCASRVSASNSSEGSSAGESAPTDGGETAPISAVDLMRAEAKARPPISRLVLKVVAKAHEASKYFCPKCAKSFASAANMRRHLREVPHDADGKQAAVGDEADEARNDDDDVIEETLDDEELAQEFERSSGSGVDLPQVGERQGDAAGDSPPEMG